MAIAAAASISLEGNCCSTSYGVINSSSKPPFHGGRRAPDLCCISFTCRNPLFGSKEFHRLPKGHDSCLSKVWVAADYPDSISDACSYMEHHGYHPLEELKTHKRIRETNLTGAEIARTTVEANSSAFLIFPAMVHCEPHNHVSWARYPFIIDDYGDIFFEIFDSENILLDRGAINPVNVFIGMDIPPYESRRVAAEYNVSSSSATDDLPFDDDFIEVVDPEAVDIPVDWEMPDTSSLVHPIYFSKCLTKAVAMEYARKMDYPSNGVSILGCLRPAFVDEESYVRRLFQFEYSDGYSSDWKGGEIVKDDRIKAGSTLYGLEIMRIELFSVYGAQSVISLQDFQDAEPDVLIHSTSAIMNGLTEKGIRCNVALKALCKKKGLLVERAHVIGIDSLGMDVRVFFGVEVQTHRFPFRVRANTEGAAEKQIQQLLCPRSRRKKLRTHGEDPMDRYSF